jgi:hypothetical protein
MFAEAEYEINGPTAEVNASATSGVSNLLLKK